MKYGISILSVVPGREEASDKAEMVTQLLFGDHYKIIDERVNWVKIRIAFDKYECWIDRKQAFEVNKEIYEEVETSREWNSCTDLVNIIQNAKNNELQPIAMGSVLPFFKDNLITIGSENFAFEGTVVHSKEALSRSKILENALLYINSPYLWGGKSPFGIDCSGLTQMVYKIAGKKLPRDAYQQAEIGTTLSFVEEAEDGDLAFFDNEEGSIIHVGILMNENEIIHASGKVRIDKIDHQGIFNVDTNTYSHKLRLIKQII